MAAACGGLNIRSLVNPDEPSQAECGEVQFRLTADAMNGDRKPGLPPHSFGALCPLNPFGKADLSAVDGARDLCYVILVGQYIAAL